MGADRVDHLAVVHLLALPAEPIGGFRRAHDPTVDLIGPHLTLVFPVPATIDGGAFRTHLRDVVSRTPPFDIRLNGLERWWDGWLFLLVADGRDEVVALHHALHTGILRPYLRTEHPYVPHVGLGLFVQERDSHDLLEIRPRVLDRPRLEEAMREAEALRLDERCRLDRVHILGLDDALTRASPLEELRLGSG
jgi:2'-5' RNA ligase